MDSEPIDNVAAQHGNMTSRSGSDSLAVAAHHHSRALGGFAAADLAPSSCVKARTCSVAPASSAQKRLAPQIRDLRPSRMSLPIINNGLRGEMRCHETMWTSTERLPRSAAPLGYD